MYIIHFISFFPNKSIFKPSNCNIGDLKKYTSPPLLLLEGTEKFYERILKCNVSHSSNGIQLKYDKYGIL